MFDRVPASEKEKKKKREQAEPFKTGLFFCSHMDFWVEVRDWHHQSLCSERVYNGTQSRRREKESLSVHPHQCLCQGKSH